MATSTEPSARSRDGDVRQRGAGQPQTASVPQYLNYGGKGIDCYSENEPWDNYVERLSGHLDACYVRNEAQRRGVLVSTVGADVYALMKTWEEKCPGRRIMMN